MWALYDTLAAVTSHELCESSGLTSRELERWMETGRLKAELVSRPGGGRQWDFTADQAERARSLKALHTKGATLSQLARANLTFDSGQACVVYDGHELRTCRDAAAAIATVVRARRPCSAVDLSAIRMSFDAA
jgi:hypothetical protein